MSDQPPFGPPSFDPPAPRPPAPQPFGAPAGPPPEPLSPIAPKSSPWKPVAIGLGAAAVLGAAVFGVIQLTGDDDQVATQDQLAPAVTSPTVTMPPGVEEALDDAEDVLASVPVPSMPVVPGMPSVPHGEPSDSTPSATAVPGSEDVSSEGDVTISIPGDMPFDAISECLGLGDLLGDLDLSDLAEMGSVPTGSLPNFEEMSPEELAELDMDDLLAQVFGEMGSQLPMGSLPFDLTILEQLDLGELGDFQGMSPEEIEELIEAQLGSLSSIPGMSVPPMSMPTPIDPADLEECLADAAP